ncbi:hypothetical protein TNIN_330351 [Trichonephila inaurata madagascariensis]|uniref:Uncharacterized protein n=1 Tax=Trichonephila inaurata madagascariensis TaxID=2747483 RepID=A0A8X6Y242_9ARAC|nr:hypothetical protein TNIN_330351 [Trichonephila inaurata madagascariensis]
MNIRIFPNPIPSDRQGSRFHILIRPDFPNPYIRYDVTESFDVIPKIPFLHTQKSSSEIRNRNRVFFVSASHPTTKPQRVLGQNSSWYGYRHTIPNFYELFRYLTFSQN